MIQSPHWWIVVICGGFSQKSQVMRKRFHVMTSSWVVTKLCQTQPYTLDRDPVGVDFCVAQKHNSFPLRRTGSNFKCVISENMLRINFTRDICETTLSWIPQKPTENIDELTYVQDVAHIPEWSPQTLSIHGECGLSIDDVAYRFQVIYFSKVQNKWMATLCLISKTGEIPLR